MVIFVVDKRFLINVWNRAIIQGKLLNDTTRVDTSFTLHAKETANTLLPTATRPNLVLLGVGKPTEIVALGGNLAATGKHFATIRLFLPLFP